MRLRRKGWTVPLLPPPQKKNLFPDMTVNKWRQQHPPPFTKCWEWAALLGETAGTGGPAGGTAAGEEEESGAQQWQSSGHKTCPTKTQHSPRFTSLPSRRGTEREQTVLRGGFSRENTTLSRKNIFFLQQQMSAVNQPFWIQSRTMRLFPPVLGLRVFSSTLQLSHLKVQNDTFDAVMLSVDSPEQTSLGH